MMGMLIVHPWEKFNDSWRHGRCKRCVGTDVIRLVSQQRCAGIGEGAPSRGSICGYGPAERVRRCRRSAGAAQFSIDTEQGYDHVIVEAHTVGTDNWTTLPDLNGGTTADVPTECEAGFLLEEHPNLNRYLTLGNPCLATGTSGSWNSFTGSYGGWMPVAFDLSAFAGQQVEVVVSYVSDSFTGGVGLLVDDTALVTNAGVTQTEGFEVDLGAWAVLGAPDGSPGNDTDFERTVGLGGIHSAISTADTLLFGFGLEQLDSPADRAAVVGAILDYRLFSSGWGAACSDARW